MNKDVIYVEPEDDITDIITKIEGSKEKIVALVPPKKAGVFRSVVNIKLISKAGKTAEKTIVLVTMDPSIIKLAATTRIPVTKNLQTAPAIPEADIEIEETTEEEIISESDDADEEKVVHAETKEDIPVNAAPDDTDEENDISPTNKKSKKPTKEKKSSTNKSGNPIINWIKSHKIIATICGISTIFIIIGLVWAFAIAPAATVTVSISTDSKDFSETVTFTTNMAEENASGGKFYLEEKKLESVVEVQFEATGQKNLGEKATGEVVVYTYFKDKGTKVINSGATFSINGLSFIANKNTTLSWDGDTVKDCENNGKASLVNSGCQISARVAVTASNAGANYNIAASNSGWNTAADVGVYSDKAMSGGTDNIVTVVEQSDIEKAKNELKTSKEEENKTKLLESISSDTIVIDSSFSQDTSTAVATPAAGEEVKDGQKPTLKATTTATIFVVEKAKVEEFITAKAKLDENQKVYKIKDPYIESFAKGDTGYSGRLKTSYSVGPKVTDSDILEIVKGKGIGEAQHDLKDINGITSVDIEKSYPWVTSIPNDSNKITINIEIKEQ